LTSKHIYDERRDIETSENWKMSLFSPESFLNHPYYFAVDGNLNTSWRSLTGNFAVSYHHMNNITEVREGDFFGLDLLQLSSYSHFFLDVGHHYQDELVLDISLDGFTWVPNKLHRYNNDLSIYCAG
jgi:hypothetical protein